jgi:hypothetical protein
MKSEEVGERKASFGPVPLSSCLTGGGNSGLAMIYLRYPRDAAIAAILSSNKRSTRAQ